MSEAPAPAAPQARPARALLLFLALPASLALAGAWADRQLAVRRSRGAAQEALRHFDYPAMRKPLERWLALRPDDRDALLLAARAARGTGRLDEAPACLDRYEAAHGSDDALLLERVLLRVERGEAGQVSAFCQERVRERHADSPLILEALARSFIRAYDLAAARDVLATWHATQPDCSQHWHLLGVVEDLLDRKEAAEAAYTRALELDDARDDARERLGDVLLRRSKAEAALAQLRPLARRKPDRLTARVLLAQALMEESRLDEADEELEAILSRAPNLGEALAARAELALLRGEAESAEALARRAQALKPGDYQTGYLLHRCLVRTRKESEADALKKKLGQMQAAILRLQEIMGKPRLPGQSEADRRAAIGRLTLELSDYQAGLRWLHSALDLEPRHREAHAVLGDFHRQAGNRGLAARHRELAGLAEKAKQP